MNLHTFIFRLTALLLCALMCVSPALAALSADEIQSADSFFTTLFEKENPVGGIVMIAQGDEILYTFATGYADKKQKIPVTEDTQFKIASTTKLITAIGLMMEYEKGAFDLDAPLRDYYQLPIYNPFRSSTPITPRQVLSHTSSIAESAGTSPRWGDPEQAETYFLKRTPGASFEYANLNGGLVGSMIELFSGQSLNDYMQSCLFHPMGIDAAYNPLLLQDTSHMACTYRKDGTLYMDTAQYLEEALSLENTCDPARHYKSGIGSLWISAKGLLSIGQMLSCGGIWEDQVYLQPETIRFMCLDQSLIQNSSVTGQSPYGLSVHRLQDETLPDTWYGHQGGWEGLVSDLYFEPFTQTTVVLIANGSPHKRLYGETCNICMKTLDYVTQHWMNDMLSEWK